MDFHELERIVDGIVGPMHNRHLNDVAAFATANPSAENVALHVGQKVIPPRGVELISVEVWETAECSAVYRA
jgi:6-pyruvoyl-tetrahydropterin synthase